MHCQKVAEESFTSARVVTALLRVLFGPSDVDQADHVALDGYTSTESILTWIPRRRPLYSASTLLHRLPHRPNALVGRADSWREVSRVYEVDPENWYGVRVTCTIEFDVAAVGATAEESTRGAEVMIQLARRRGALLIAACSVVYDEPASGPSPLTQVAQKLPVELRELARAMSARERFAAQTTAIAAALFPEAETLVTGDA